MYIRQGNIPFTVNLCHIQVLEGMDVVRKIENTTTAAGDIPVDKVIISTSGYIPVKESFATERNAAKE